MIENPNQQLDVSCIHSGRLHNTGKKTIFYSAFGKGNNDSANYVGCHSNNKTHDLTMQKPFYKQQFWRCPADVQIA